MISAAEYEALAPVQWPLRARAARRDVRFFGAGGFFAPGRKARVGAVAPPPWRPATSKDFPFRLNPGRIRDQWHTMTRTGLSPRLSAHSPEPFVEVHPFDARAAGLMDGGFAKISTRHGACVLRVVISEGQRRGS